MQDEKGAVRLLDLGLVRFLDDPTSNLTLDLQPDAVLGAVEYLAPEQVTNSHGVDLRADIYALGATMYFLLTGKAPFSQHAILRLAAGVVTHPQPLAQLRPDVPRELIDAVDRMMAASPEARFQTAEEAAAALQRWLAEVSPPPLCELRHTSTRVPVLTRPDLEDLLPPEEGPADGPPPAPEAERGWSVLAVTLAAVAAFVGLLMFRLYG